MRGPHPSLCSSREGTKLSGSSRRRCTPRARAGVVVTGTNHAGVVAGSQRLPGLRGLDNKGEALLGRGACLHTSPRPGGRSQELQAPRSPRVLLRGCQPLCLLSLPGRCCWTLTRLGLEEQNPSAVGQGGSRPPPQTPG